MFTAFSYEIVFGGEFRKNPYIDESGKKIIEVTDTLDPDDGIIQLLMIERINAENAEVHIFVDKDWKDYFGSKARIVWGKEFQNQKALDYNEVSQGVYHDSVIDDPGRFPKGYDDFSIGAVVVGSATKQDLQGGKIEGMDAVFIR